jgi:hypothetical protein
MEQYYQAFRGGRRRDMILEFNGKSGDHANHRFLDAAGRPAS